VARLDYLGCLRRLLFQLSNRLFNRQQRRSEGSWIVDFPNRNHRGGHTWIFALCQFLSGPLLDRMGARRILVPAILLVSIGVFIFANAKDFGMLLMSQALIALGACTGFVGAGYIGGKWFGMAKFSFMFGLVQFAASLFSAFTGV
jgi:sugar phosphate permease